MVSSGPLTTSSRTSSLELRRSSSSTVRYQQESFSKFQDRVQALCATLWPGTSTEEVKIERMRGGSYNRVIKITVSGESKKSPRGRDIGGVYVLRIPRGRIGQIEQELAAIFYAREKAGILAPETIEFDLTRDNAIGEVYNIQLKITGRPLCDVYMSMSQTERLSIIGQLAIILKNMRGVHSPKPGYFGTRAIKREKDGSIVPEIKIVDFKINTFKSLTGEILWGGMKDDSAESKSVERFLIDQFEGWREFARKARRSEKEDKLIGEFCKVVGQMKAVNLLGEGYFLFHPDFAPQNILVSENRDEGYEQGCQSPENQLKWVVSGILDWDGTAFVPYSVACTPPTWIWDWDGGDEEDEAVVRKKLEDDPEAQERKEKFDQLMDPFYTEHAYSDGNRLVRRLFEFARNGFSYQNSHEDARRFLEDWKEKSLEIEKALQSPKPTNEKRGQGFFRMPKLFNGSRGGSCFS